mgnify:CR=1 FL=1
MVSVMRFMNWKGDWTSVILLMGGVLLKKTISPFQDFIIINNNAQIQPCIDVL